MNATSFSPLVRNLASGAAISAGQGFGHATFPFLRRKNNFSFTGQFLNGQSGFAGIEFKEGGNTHYGWIRLHATIGPDNAVTETAVDWAYNTVAGQEILAGQGVPTPEPGTTSMALLAAGAAGLLALRKRRKQLAAE